MGYNEAMYIRKCKPSKSHTEKIYWQLVESYRSERGPRQRVVAYLGDVEEELRRGAKEAAEGRTKNDKFIFLMRHRNPPG